MSIDLMQTLDVIEAMENYIFKIRPPENLRDQVDIVYKIDKQSVIIYEIRPRWNNPKEFTEAGVAKTTFVKAKQQWNVFWMRADLKWHTYQPKPSVKTFSEFVDLVEKDRHHCFWG